MPFGPKAESARRLQDARNAGPSDSSLSVTYYVVVPFDRNEVGTLAAGEAKEVPTAKKRLTIFGHR
jgi:hypothetical protein